MLAGLVLAATAVTAVLAVTAGAAGAEFALVLLKFLSDFQLIALCPASVRTDAARGMTDQDGPSFPEIL